MQRQSCQYLGPHRNEAEDRRITTLDSQGMRTAITCAEPSVTFVPWRRGEPQISFEGGKEAAVKLRVAVADDEPGFLKAFVCLLGEEFEVVATAPDGKSALESIAELRPDVVVLDLNLPDINGIELTRRLTKMASGTAVVLCSVARDKDIVDAAFEAGALGYVWKNRIARDLVPAIKAATEERRFVSLF